MGSESNENKTLVGLLAGIGRGLGTPDTVAGDITLNATGEIKVEQRQGRHPLNPSVRFDTASSVLAFFAAHH